MRGNFSAAHKMISALISSVSNCTVLSCLIVIICLCWVSFKTPAFHFYSHVSSLTLGVALSACGSVPTEISHQLLDGLP